MTAAAMHELSRYLYLAGGVPILLLGIVHVLATPLRRDKPRGLSPADSALIDAMSATTVRLTRRVDLWRGWVGFNLSHGLGAIVFGVLTLLLGRSESSFTTQAPLFGPLAVLVSAVYLGLAVKYWFFAPIIACAASFALFLLSWALFQFGGG